MRMSEWFISIVFAPLDGEQTPGAAAPRPYSLLRRQVNPLSLMAAGLRTTKNQADAAVQESIHLQRWTIAQIDLRWPDRYQDVRSLLLADLASSTDQSDEQISLYLE